MTRDGAIMAVSHNYLKCRFCAWMTRKWGRKSNPDKAFARLREHLVDAHPDEEERITAAAAVHAAQHGEE